MSRSGIPTASLSTGENFSGHQVYYGPRHSIAVLPFTDRSPQPGRPYRPDGFTHELIQDLVLIPGLQVTARTSSFFFRDELPEAKIVGQRLQASYLLTGSFSQESDQLVVEARLLGARENRELWSGTFEFDVHQLADTRREIAAEALDEAGFRSATAPTSGTSHAPQARERYREGLYGLELRSAENLAKAGRAFEQALELEPAYSDALLGLVMVKLATAQPARELLDELLQIDPDSPGALGVLSYIQRELDWDWHAAAQSGRRAVELRPGDAGLLSRASLALFSLGEFEESASLLQGSIDRDPLNLHSRLRLGLLQEFSGELDESLATYRVIAGLNAEYPGLYAYRTRVKVLQDKPGSALEESEKETSPFWGRYAQILALLAAGRMQEAEPLLEQMASEDGDYAAFQLAELHAFKGAADPAFAWLQKAQEQRDGGMGELIGNALLTSLHEDPRWTRLLEALGLPLDGPQ